MFKELGLRYHLCGGAAARVYGATRPLNDLDFEVPDAALPTVEQALESYVKFPCERFRDAKWDLLMVQFEINGQWVDISGADSGLMTNLAKTEWVSAASEFTRDEVIKIGNIHCCVMPVDDLITYKRLLDYDHQQHDIAACENYLNSLSAA